MTKICIIYTECMCDTAHNLCEITRFSYTYRQANSNILRMFGIHIAFSCIISIFITTCQYVMILYTRMFEASTSGCRERQHPGVECRKMGMFPNISACFPLFSSLFSAKRTLCRRNNLLTNTYRYASRYFQNNTGSPFQLIQV